MKKILVVATIAIAGLVSAKGAVETKTSTSKKATVAFQLCGVTVTFYNSTGQITGQQMYTSDQPNLTSCMAYQAGVIANLRARGYRVEQL